jgi:3-hydroxyisobutyrate dehydrogenase
MLAGERDAADAVRPLLGAMCGDTFDCGPAPGALLMKLSVNLFLITLVTGLTEAFHFADRLGLERGQLTDELAAGPMASGVSRMKAAKPAAGDFDVQAAASGALKNNRLIAGAARRSGVASPLPDVRHALFDATVGLGHGQSDMVSVLRAIEAHYGPAAASELPSPATESGNPSALVYASDTGEGSGRGGRGPV